MKKYTFLCYETAKQGRTQVGRNHARSFLLNSVLTRSLPGLARGPERLLVEDHILVEEVPGLGTLNPLGVVANLWHIPISSQDGPQWSKKII